jgi:hypothetical protein
VVAVVVAVVVALVVALVMARLVQARLIRLTSLLRAA